MVADRRLDKDQWVRRVERSTIGSLFSAEIGKLYRSIWISDLHLGTRACKADILLDFLQHNKAENLYLVGDIIDGWNLGPSWYWSSAQNEVVEEIASWHRRGAHVVFLPGNHDEPHAALVESLFGLIPMAPELVHRTAEGRRMLVTHGHQFDSSLSSSRWPSMMGSQAYAIALRIEQWHRRDRFNFGQRSLSSYLKRPITRAVQYFSTTDMDERAVFERAREHKADGVICGHTHRVEQRLIGPIWYINDGDWVEGCTALVEDYNGALSLLRWGSTPDRLAEPDTVVTSEEAS